MGVWIFNPRDIHLHTKTLTMLSIILFPFIMFVSLILAILLCGETRAWGNYKIWIVFWVFLSAFWIYMFSGFLRINVAINFVEREIEDTAMIAQLTGILTGLLLISYAVWYFGRLLFRKMLYIYQRIAGVNAKGGAE